MKKGLCYLIMVLALIPTQLFGVVDMNLAANGGLSGEPIKLTVNGASFDPSLPNGTGLYNYDLPEKSALISKGLLGDKGINLRIINFDNRPWTLSVGPGVFLRDDGNFGLIGSSQALFMITFAGTYDAIQSREKGETVYYGSDTNPLLKNSIQTKTFTNLSVKTTAYISSTLDTDHGTLGQAAGFSNGTEILAQLALNLSPLQPAGTYSGTINFNVSQ